MGMRIAINGFGRIGRNVFRIIHQSYPTIDVVAINDITSNDTLAHLLKYDSVHGPFKGKVSATGTHLKVDGKKVMVVGRARPDSKLPHKQNRIDFVIEATGVFASREQCAMHLEAGAKRVLLDGAAQDPRGRDGRARRQREDPQARLTASSRNASCTTNCLAPLAKVLHDKFKIQNGSDDHHARLHQRPAVCSTCPTRTCAGREPRRPTSSRPRPEPRARSARCCRP